MPETSTGVVLFVVVPSPNLPSVLDQIANIMPVVVTAKVLSDDESTCLILDQNKVEFVGTSLWLVVPSAT